MRYGLLFALASLIALGGCGKQATRSADPLPSQDAASGRVVIPADSPKLNQIRVEPVAMRDVPSDEVLAPGKVEVNPNRVSHLVLPVTGRVTSVLVRIGDAVKQGQPLLEIESPEADAAMSAHLQAQAGVTQAKAAAVKAQADLDRLRDLFEHNAVARKEVLAAENSLVQSTAAVEQAEAVSEQALRRLEILGLKPDAFGQRVAMRAPISGKVLDMNIVPGEYRNDMTVQVMTIADLATVWISSDVPESAIRFIRAGERLDIELSAYPGEVFRGRVTRIADVVDPQTRTVKVRAEMDNSSGRLRPEMFGQIRHVDTMRRLPVLPPGAVIQGDGQSVAYVEVARGTYEPRPVRVGDRVAGWLPVLGGIAPGERVVVDGIMLLKGM